MSSIKNIEDNAINAMQFYAQIAIYAVLSFYVLIYVHTFGKTSKTCQIWCENRLLGILGVAAVMN